MTRAVKSQGAASPAPVNAFTRTTRPPTDAELEAALGLPALALWKALLKRLGVELDLDVSEWHSYSPKAGWSIRVKRAKRNIVYLVPCRGALIAAFALGEKAVAAAHAAGLPVPILRAIENAPRYAEGRGVRLVVGPGDLDAIVELARVKLQN